MSDNFNSMVVTKANWYIMMPGDGTMYRFFYSEMASGPIHEQLYVDRSYVQTSGASHAPDAYVMLGIIMPHGTGIGAVMKNGLGLDEVKNTHAYLLGHEFSAVNEYTLMAVLLALRTLLIIGGDELMAAHNMLRADELLLD